MVSNFPITSHEGLTSVTPHSHAAGLGVMDRVRQMICGLHGHDTLLAFENHRMSLRCVSCGHETPGWELNEAPPTVTVRGDARRHALRAHRLVSDRRIA